MVLSGSGRLRGGWLRAAGLSICVAALLAGGGQPRRATLAPPRRTGVAQHPRHALPAAAVPEAAPQAAAPAPRLRPRKGLPIPVLMYHVIARPPANAPWKGLYVAPSLFARQMRALRRAGFRAITLNQAYAVWRGRAAAPRHPFVLSFDDGYVSVFQNAWPVLRRMRWPGVLCQQVQRVDFPGGLSVSQIRTLLAGGWQLAAHGVSQPEVDLTQAPPALAAWEVESSRQDLRRRFGAPVSTFCYPVGHYDPAAVRLVRHAGYRLALSTVPGAADPAVEGYLRLDRIRVSAGEPPQVLVAVLRKSSDHAPATPPTRFPEPPPPVRPVAARPTTGRPAGTSHPLVAQHASAPAGASQPAAAQATSKQAASQPASAQHASAPAAASQPAPAQPRSA